MNATAKKDLKIVSEVSTELIAEVVKMIEVRAYQINGNYPELSDDCTQNEIANLLAKMVFEQIKKNAATPGYDCWLKVK